jgi:hypothetical protein
MGTRLSMGFKGSTQTTLRIIRVVRCNLTIIIKTIDRILIKTDNITTNSSCHRTGEEWDRNKTLLHPQAIKKRILTLTYPLEDFSQSMEVHLKATSIKDK